MNLKKHYLLVAVILSLAGVAAAQTPFAGSVGVQEDTTQSGSFTAGPDGSLMLDVSNYTDPLSGSGTFSTANVPNATEVIADGVNLAGLSTTPTTEDISDYLQIGSPGTFSSVGTSPNNRFDFELQTLAENSSGDFTGTGILTDTAGDYTPTAAEFLLSFTPDSDNYSFTLQAVPEPATVTLVLAGLGVLPFLRRKK
jgi:hypothetical protein